MTVQSASAPGPSAAVPAPGPSAAASGPVLSLAGGTEAAANLHLEGLAPGEHGVSSVVVRYRDAEDAVIGLQVECPEPGAMSRNVHVGVFEQAGGLMPFPVFSGTLLDLARRDRPFGRWTGRGDGEDHEVVYEISTSVARDAASASEPADVTFRFTATPPASPTHS
ncbi:hypothetical protein [Actinomadura rupiterrae]|uniref:hypothetical protein n=1 Tax=Actinomadura rupiterrae TaxID=559627 RepID=UPI0020A479EB|nr:hypothetical protein [Actinomadura rupiterrae]MCP2336353.1 hypothetical protein [Actinomadura rupiterrae]